MTCASISSFKPLPQLPAPPPPQDPPPLPPLPPLTGIDPFPALPPTEEASVPDPGPPPPVDVGRVPPEPWQVGAASNVVGDIMASTGSLAGASQGAALGTLGLMGGAAMFTPIEAPPIPSVSVGLPVGGDAPAAPDLTFDFPALPEAPVIDLGPSFTADAPPAYDAGELLVSDLSLPDPLAVLLPAAPDLAPVAVPLAPDFTLPPAPTLDQLVIPDAPVLTLPLLDASLGARPDAPNVALAFAEASYGSQLLSAMTDRLSALVLDAAATGIDPAVEQGIWARAAAREALLTTRASASAERLLRARGFAMPPDTQARMIGQALQGGLARSASLARSVAIERANLAQQNLRFAIESINSLEARLIDKYNAVQARALQAARALIQAEIANFNGLVKLFSADVAAFAMKAEVFKTRLQSALASISVYQAQIQAALARGEVNAQAIAIYQAQVGGVRVLADTYRTQVEAAQQLTEANKARAEQYQAAISAYQTQVSAKESEYEAFAAAVRAQGERAQLFEKQVGAYRARVGAYDALVKAKVGVLDLQLKQEGEFPLALFQARIDAYRGASEAAVEQLRANASVYGTRIRAYAATEAAKTDLADASVRVAQANIEGVLAEASLSIEAAHANLQAVDAYAGMVQNNLRSAGQIAGQLSAAAIAARSVHISVSESNSTGISNSDTRGGSHTESRNSLTSRHQSASTNHSTTRMSGASYNDVVSNTAGRHINRGTSNTESIAYSNSTSNSTMVNYTNTAANTFASNFTSAFECIDRTVKSE